MYDNINVFLKSIVSIYFYTERKNETHINFECYLYQRCVVCVNESVFEMLKLVRRPLNVYFMTFKSIVLSLCIYYLGWLSCWISFERCQSSCEEYGTSENYKKFLSTVGFELPACPSNHSATGTVDDMRLELLQYLFTPRYHNNSAPCEKEYTENENKIIANLQFGDWYHLNTRWLTQKKKFIMSYVSITIY